MIRIAICGINGKMGQVLKESIEKDADTCLAFGVDVANDIRENGVPVYKEISQVPQEKVDVIIDFSRPSALKGNLDYCIKYKKAIVIATTGYTEEEKVLIHEAAKSTAVFYSANYSLGVNLQMKLIAEAAKLFNGAADIEIIEKHHNRKADAPSGTALMLADGINEACGGKYKYKYGRTPNDSKREKNELGIHAVRGGMIVGEHDVMFITDNEIVTISHQAMSRNVFADGAVAAAKFMTCKSAGFYNMKGLLEA